MARSGEVLRLQAAGHALQRRRSSGSEGCRVSLPSEPSLQTPLPLKPLVEFTKFELTWALLSLQKRVLRVHFLLGGKGPGSAEPGERGLLFTFIRLQGNFCSQGKVPTQT